MAIEPMGPPPVGNQAKYLPLRWLVALIAAMCVIIAVIGAVAEDVGRDQGGDTGAWIGWAVTFTVVCAMCWILTLKVANPFITLFCAMFFGMGLSKAAEDICRQLGKDFWAKPVGFLTFFAGYVLWVTLVSKLITNRRPPLSTP